MTLNTRVKALLGIAAVIIGYVVFGESDPQPVQTSGPAHAATAHSSRDGTSSQSRVARALTLLAHRVADPSGAEALFAGHSWYIPPPPPPPPPPAAPAAADLAPPVPTAPPLPFAYIGTYTPDGATSVFFLTRGDRVYDVRVGDVLDNIYSIDGVRGGQLLLTYKPLNIQQQLSVGGSP